MASNTQPKQARTRRGEGYATSGAVRQHGGSLPVYWCNTCETEVVWVTSTRTGRAYLVNVSRGYHGARYYVGVDFHDCARVLERRAEYTANETTIPQLGGIA